MALSERATFLIAKIDTIIEKNRLDTAMLPILRESKPRPATSITIVDRPLVISIPNVTASAPRGIAPPVTPFTPSYSSKPAPAPVLIFEENPKTEARDLLLAIKEKIATSDDEYLKFDNVELRSDINRINNMLDLKFKKFRALTSDFIILVNELSAILNTEETLIFERHVEQRSRTLTREQSREEDKEPICGLFSRCRYFS